MSDPTGTLGAARPVSDVDIAMSGGADFMSRLKQLGDAKDAAARHWPSLRLAKTAQAAMADADSKRKSADDALQTAQKTLADAQAKATEIVQDAQGRVMHVKAEAQAAAEQKVAEAETERKRTLLEASDIRKDAAKALADAKQKLKETEAARLTAKKAADDLESANSAAVDALARYQVVKAKFEAKLARIKAMVAELDRDS